jgi:hypothetical protein
LASAGKSVLVVQPPEIVVILLEGSFGGVHIAFPVSGLLGGLARFVAAREGLL